MGVNLEDVLNFGAKGYTIKIFNGVGIFFFKNEK